MRATEADLRPEPSDPRGLADALPPPHDAPVLDDFAELARHLCGTPVGALVLVEEPLARVCARDATEQQALQCGTALCRHALTATGLVEIADLRADPRFAGHPLVDCEGGLRFQAAAPLRDRAGAVLGVLCVLDHRPRRLDALTRAALERLARLAVQALQTRVGAPAPNEAGPAQPQPNAGTLLQSLPVGVLVLDRSMRTVQANASAARILGMSEEAMLGRDPIAELDAAIDQAGQPILPAQRPAQLTLADGQPRRNVAYGLRRHDGQRRWLTVSTAPLTDAAGTTTGVVKCFVDHTDERDQRRLLSLAIEAARIAPWHWDPVADVVEFDRDTAVAAGLRVDAGGPSAMRLPLWPSVHRDDVERLRLEIARLEADPQRPLRAEFRMPGVDGRWRWVFIAGAVAERDADGRVVRVSGVLLDIDERKQAEAALRRAATTDTLTGLPNRSVLGDRLQQALRAARRNGRAGGLLSIDLDHFKRINDVYGHLVGDRVLQVVAERLQAELRTSDTLARMGGDELMVLLPDLGPETAAAAAGAEHVADKLLAALARPLLVDGLEYTLGASIGCTVFPKSVQESAEDLLREVDTAMYAAKAAGRGMLRRYEHGMQHSVAERLALEHDLRRALGGDELGFALQGKWTCQGRLAGAELLLRWQHPQRGAVSPAQFIPVAEESSLILALGRRVIGQALALQARWLAEQRPLPLAVNVSPRQFREPGFADELAAMARAAGVPPPWLTLEITEGVLLDAAAARRLEQLAALGFRFSIDDFGTGYSSLMYLKQLPVHELKIDRAFVRDLTTDPEDRAIVQAVLAIARKFRLDVVAEGVETREQADFLAAHDCTLLQGFLFDRPAPLAEFEQRRQAG